MVIIFLFSMALVVAMTMCILVLGVTFLIDKIVLISDYNNWCLGEEYSPDIHKENNSKEIDSNDKGRSSNRNCEEDEHQ